LGLALSTILFNEVRSGRGHESFLQAILGTRNLVHYLFRPQLNGIGLKQDLRYLQRLIEHRLFEGKPRFD
jgi:hypothetical protein